MVMQQSDPLLVKLSPGYKLCQMLPTMMDAAKKFVCKGIVELTKFFSHCNDCTHMKLNLKHIH